MKVFDVALAPNEAKLTCYVQDPSQEMATADVRPAMLVFPGGGYEYCSDREAEPIALAYLAEGYNAFVLRYAVGKDMPWERSFEDAQAALRYVRENAAELRIDRDKVAVVGFSAGGHLASALGTVAEEKPDALVLGYPVILDYFGKTIDKNLPGTDKAVTEATPPTFIFSTSNDGLVPIRNSLAFARALADADLLFEVHIYVMGEHGCSLAKAAQAGGNPGVVNPDAQNWLSDSVRFLRHVFGDFPVRGRENKPDMPNYQKPSLDIPVKLILKRADWAAALDAVLPGASAMLRKDPIAQGLSLRQIAAWSPKVFSLEVVARLEAAFDKM